jgi:hypothetical protein
MSNDQHGQTPVPDDDATRASGVPTGADRPRPAYGEYAPTPPAGAAPADQPPVVPGAPQGAPYGAPQQSAPQQVTTTGAPTAGTPGPKGIGAFAGEGHPQTLATFTRYEDAQSAVDLLSDEGFPVESVSIVGHDIRTVENVAGRLTTGKAAARGAAGGAWFGLLLGLLFSIFAPGVAFIGVLLIALGAGALWGALWGAVGHAATRGRRDFASVKTMEAGRYEVLVRGELSARAHQVLAQGRKTA